jgi:hypothetical protein
MRVQPGFLKNNRLLVVIWSLWFLSAATLLVSQSMESLGFGDAPQEGDHPEIPASDPAPVLAVIAACNERVKPEDTLWVVYQDSDPQQLYVAYRLAYELYPRHVSLMSYGEVTFKTTIHRLEAESPPTLVLAFAEPGLIPEGSTTLAQLPLNSCLYQPAASRNP